MEFSLFKQAVAKQFAFMSKYPLFETSVSGDELWETYLSSFPEGANPIYRERTEHDCSCCKQFIRNIGNVVALIDGEAISIWDIRTTNSAYDIVAKALKDKVCSQILTNVFLHYEKTVGTDKNFEQLVNGQKAWEHFHVTLPSTCVRKKEVIAGECGAKRTHYEQLCRALDTIGGDSVNTVLELIDQNSIYRGMEHRSLVQSFKEVQEEFLVTKMNLNKFVWNQVIEGSSVICAIRNTVIGTLLVDLSEGVSLEHAVASFEAKVAPTNYKRPTALVTKEMINRAKKTLTSLGLISSLDRRYATIDDIKITDIIFASSTARSTITNDVFDTLAAGVKVKPTLNKVEEVTIEKFISDILPTATGIEVLVENRHSGNFVTLIAPVDPTAPSLFKWNNSFSWSYNGDMADSIKERVKRAGGNVEGELCCRLAWNYTDDLDFHMQEPNDYEIYFANRNKKSPCGGMLDVDANGCDGIRNNPAENILYSFISSMKFGKYELVVHNFARRSNGVGFEVEIDLMGHITSVVYDKVIPGSSKVKVATITKTKEGVTVTPSLPSTQASKVLWGLTTQTFVPVSVMMLSPNHWEDSGSGIGNKHYFFMLDGCKNNSSSRGFFNEFLKPESNPHRKVIEMVGSKMKTAVSDQQLSGLGFSSTQRNSITCRVTGSFTRSINITF